MKTYPKSPREQFDAVKPETINDNLDESLAEFNGNLDANNMPINSVVQSKWNAPVSSNLEVTPVQKFSVEYPTQTYHNAKRREWVTGNLYIPTQGIDLATASWSRGWNSVDLFGTGWDECHLEFTAKQGMLVGQVTIDWERGTTARSTTQVIGWQRWTEWGIFVNNILVARSGPIYPRRHTTNLPFSIPIGSQNAKVECRWRSNVGETDSGIDYHMGNLELFGMEFCVRNQYR